MPPLGIPDRFRVGVIRVATLESSAFNELVEALKRSPECKNLRELTAWIKDETPLLNESDRIAIIQALVPMVRVQQNANVSSQKFADDVWDSLLATEPKATDGLDAEESKRRIASLIDQKSLDLASYRIGDAKREVERNFCKVKVMTDLRPAFRSTDDFTEMAIIHNFQIGYHDGRGKHKEFYVALDAADLEKLKRAIALAEERSSTLERVLVKSGVQLHK